jgi:transcriptional regulator with XRE-family HTH domain
MEKKIHQGKNITRFRQMLGIKQDVLATIMGDEWNQIKISRLEGKEEIEADILDEVATALKVPVEAIKNFDEDDTVNIISNTVNNHDNGKGDFNNHCNFNPLDKYVEAMEKNEKLYEALLKSERDKIELMQKFLDRKQ